MRVAGAGFWQGFPLNATPLSKGELHARESAGAVRAT